MQKEPVFGQEINYLFNGGACVSAKYMAEQLGYYEEYGINAKYLAGGSVVDAVAAMENGEVDASIFSDYFVIANYKEEMRAICSITTSEEFQDEPCCVTAMNNDFIEQNPVHAKYVVKAIKRAGEYNRLNPDEAIQIMYDTDMMTGEVADQTEFWNSLHFGLSDVFTERALREIAEDYIRLGIITKADITVDEVMDMAWTNICPDEEIDGLTVGDPVDVEGATIPVQQYEK